MPKDYRERRIDIEPPRVRTKQARQSVTAASPDSGGGMGAIPVDLTVPIVTISPGDGVLWFLRQPTADAAPSGRNVVLTTTEDGAVTHTYADLPSGWANYITSFAATYTIGVDGFTIVTDETCYVIWDQFTGFTAGNYKLDFSAGSGTVDKALLLRNIDPADPGTFYSGMSQSPTWSKTYISNDAPDITNNFPRTVTIGASGTARHMYAIYQMSGTVEAPAAIYSAPGVALLSYTFTDPTDPPAFKRSIVTFYGDTLSTTTSAEIVGPWENGWGGVV